MGGRIERNAQDGHMNSAELNLEKISLASDRESSIEDLALKGSASEAKADLRETRSMDHAVTIGQLGGKFIAMTGAHGFSKMSECELSFRVGKNPGRVRGVSIRLTPMDEYAVTLYRFTGAKMSKEQIEGIYCDMLAEVIGERLGMDIAL
jgi:hypothetical protein